MSICSFCPPTHPNSSRRTSVATDQHALVNRYFAAIDELEEVQLAQCVTLQHQPDLIRSTTLFHWGPMRMTKRHRPKEKVV